jgi:hypothetical protein
MTKQQFIIECNERFICPSVAIENENIWEALQEPSAFIRHENICTILDCEF